MASRKKLTPEEIASRLQSVSGWSVVNGKLHKEFRFRDFTRAFSFMTGGALIAERLNHHPEWSNVYSWVVVDLVTHSVDGISELDFEFAAGLNSLSDAGASELK